MKNKTTFRSEMLEDRALLAAVSCTTAFEMTASCVLEAGIADQAAARITGGSMVLSSDASDLTKSYFSLNNATLEVGNNDFSTIAGRCSLVNGQSGAGGSAVSIDKCNFPQSFSGAKTLGAPGFFAPVSFPLVSASVFPNPTAIAAGELTFAGPAILTWTIDPDRCQSTFGLDWNVQVKDSTSAVVADFATDPLSHVGSGVTALHNPNINFDMCKSLTPLNQDGVFEIKPQKAGDPLDVLQQKLNRISDLFPLN